MSAVVEVRDPSAKCLSTLLPPLVQHFELMVTARGGVARLRELTLTLAVQGKLVPQDPSDEPAIELLKEIRAGKDRLIVVSKTRREKPLEPITEKEQPFKLPQGWKWARFGEVSINRDGERIPVSSSDRDNRAKKYDYYGASGVIDKIDGFLFDKTLLLIGEDGANLISRSTPIAFLAHGQYWVNNHAHVIDTTHSELMNYLALFINAISLEPYVTGTAQPKMNQAKLNSIVVALPPLAEQSRIVARVEELMCLCDALEAKSQLEAAQQAQLVQTLLGALTASATSDELVDNWQRVATHFDLLLDRPEAIDALEQTVLQMAVRGLLVPQDPNDEPASELLKKIRADKERLIAAGKMKRDKPLPAIAEEDAPFTLPQGWEWSRIGDLVSIKHGYAFSSSYFLESAGPFVLTTPGNFLEDGGFRHRGNRTKFYSGPVPEDFTLRAGDLIIAMTEQAAGLLGSAAFIPDDGKIYLHNQRLGKLIFDRSLIEAEYVFHYFNGRYLRACVADSSTGMKVKHTSPEKISLILFPLPPLPEQTRIVARVEALRRLCADLRQRLAARQTTQAHLAEALIDEVA